MGGGRRKRGEPNGEGRRKGGEDDLAESEARCRSQQW